MFEDCVYKNYKIPISDRRLLCARSQGIEMAYVLCNAEHAVLDFAEYY